MKTPTSGEKLNDGHSSQLEKRNNQGIVLIPQPSDDPADSLNWRNARKFRILAILCLAAFSGTAGALAGQLAFAVQAKVYNKTTLELSYSSSAAYAGIAGGPLILSPLVYIVGRPSVIFWSLLGSLACAVWSACLTKSTDYIPFVMSRLLSGIFGSLPANLRHTAAPVLIGLSPAAGLAGLFIMIFFGWALLLNIISPVLLEKPAEEGGYGFTSAQIAAFNFSQWIGLFLAQAVGIFYNDRFPLWICKRFKKGVWAPELRLYCLFIPILCLPIGLGISAAALQYHYHYMVLALGVFISLFAGLLAQPIIVNYVVECYTDYAVESTIIVAVYRLGWGIAITFFVGQWEARINVGWVFGMSAFFALASGLLVLVLIWKGHVLRRWSLVKSLISTEAGREVL
ncbi:MAG: hypothetical protein ASARMPRED_007328 [Alectoria sarmentosa]|nr:MAG: hypothetical protein ASARMPRED_007328 [Alectoria sarmentosa]